MAFNVKVPSVGESVQEAMVHKWHVKSGDHVAQDDVLVELETDKATVEIVSEVSGVVTISKNKGDTVGIGDVLATIDTDAKASGKDSDKKASSNGNGSGKHAVDEDESESEAPAVEERAAATDKNTAKKASEKAKPAAGVAASTATSQSDSGREGVFSPAARKIAAEHGIEKVSGTGRGGRITKEDVLSKVNGNGHAAPNGKSAKEAPAPEKTAKAPERKELPGMTGHREERREKMTMIRRSIARHLVHSQQTAAMLTTFNDVDMTAVLELRKKYKDTFKERYGISLGFMGFFMKAAVEALREFPLINAYVDGEEIIYHDYIDVGVAVSTERGLMVPVIRNVEHMSLVDIELSVAAMAAKGREGKIKLEDLSGGTFTVSNGGVFGSMMSTPILNSPQSAILGMHRIEERPVVRAGQIVARSMMYLALSYDHRIVDGKEAVQFLVKIKEGIEDPNRLLLGV